MKRKRLNCIWLAEICQGTKAKQERNEGQDLETTQHHTGMMQEGIKVIMDFGADNLLKASRHSEVA